MGNKFDKDECKSILAKAAVRINIHRGKKLNST